MKKSLLLSLFSLVLVSSAFAQGSTGSCSSGDCKNGYGVFVFVNGDRFEGDFKAGMKHGQGTYTTKNGDTYQGMYKEDRRHGYGTYRWANGAIYIGEYANGKRNGNGQFIDEHGTVQEGIYADNKYVGAAPKASDVAAAPAPKPAPKALAAGPEVSFLTPKNEETVTQKDYTIRACIKSTEEIENIKVYVDGDVQSTMAQRGFMVDQEEKCDNMLKRQVLLHPGQNRIIIEAYSKNGGKTVVESKVVTYNEPAQSGEALVEARVALVIGNASYEKIPLKNSVNDATAMANKLEALGFQVIKITDADLTSMKKKIREFGEILTKTKGVGMFYYAGHGIQYKGDNYLLPVGAAIEKEADIEFEAIDIGRVLVEMSSAKNNLNIVVLDACRDNPFASMSRSMSSSNGLTSIDRAPSGTYIAYATSPGSVASDGDGENGLYTQALLTAMEQPGLKLEDMFKKVRVEVRKKSNNQQVPWENSSVEGDFYFKGQ